MNSSYFKVETNGIELVVHDMGGTGEPVLFMHAASLNGRTWKPVTDQLQNYRCFALDIRAHGMSSSQSEYDLVWEDIAKDIPKVVAAIKQITDRDPDEPLLAVGHSLGAVLLMIAQIKQPELFKKLWLYEPVFFPKVSKEYEQRTEMMIAGALRRKSSFPSRQAASDRFVSKPPFMSFNEDCLEQYVQYGLKDVQDKTDQVELCCTPVNEAEIYKNANSGIIEELKMVQIPVRIAVGNDDQDRVPAIRNAIQSTEIDLIELEGLSHFGVQTHPKKIAEEITKWFNQ